MDHYHLQCEMKEKASEDTPYFSVFTPIDGLGPLPT